MRVTSTKSKNAEFFYITKSFINDQGKSTSMTIRKLGTLAELSAQLETDRNGVLAWAKEQAIIETKKYKLENEKIQARKRKQNYPDPFSRGQANGLSDTKIFHGRIPLPSTRLLQP